MISGIIMAIVMSGQRTSQSQFCPTFPVAPDVGQLVAMIQHGNAFGEEAVLRHSPYHAAEQADMFNAPAAENFALRRHTVLPSGRTVQLLRIQGAEVGAGHGFEPQIIAQHLICARCVHL